MNEEIIRALGDPRRVELMRLLGEHNYCVRALARKSGLSESAVSQHLKILREAGLVNGIKWGYFTHYRIERDAVVAVRDELGRLLEAMGAPTHNGSANCPMAQEICRKERKEEC